MNDQASSNEQGSPRKTPWQRIGIAVREIVNRRSTGKDAQGKSKYLEFGSSWLVIVPAKVTKRGRLRRQFNNKAEAIAFAEGQADLHRASGPRAFVLSDFEREDAVKALTVLRELGLTFQQAADFARRHLRPEGGDKTVGKLAEKILAEKRAENLRPDSIRTLSWNLARIQDHFGADRVLKTISREDVDGWHKALQEAGHKGRNLRNYIRYTRQFFQYATLHRHCAENPAALLKAPRIDWKAPPILTLQETRRLLRTAMLPEHSDLLPALVLQLFVGGIRTAEVTRLTWEKIDLQDLKVDIDPATGKNRRDGDWRIPTIPTGAAEFLIRHPKRDGSVTPPRYKDRMTALHKAAGFADYDGTHKNAKRHSFGSYGCKLHGTNWVQDQMGHNTPATFLKYYRNARVTGEDARAYFELTPQNLGQAAEVVSLSKGAA
jgi:integrase